MRAYKSFFFLIIFNILNINGQLTYKKLVDNYKNKEFNQKKADSILSLLAYKDSLYAQTSHSISFYFYKKEKKYDLAIKYGEIETHVLEKLNLNNKAYANALYNLGKFHFKKGDYNSSIKYYKKAIKSNASPLKTAQSYCGIGRCYRIKGDYYKSLDYYQKGLPLIKKYSTLGSLVSRYINYSLSCKEMNTKKSALLGINALKKADSILQKNPEIINDNRFYPLNVNLANLYSQEHFFNYKKAKYYYLKNLKRALKNKNNLLIANSYSNVGELYFKQKKDSCLFFFKKSIEYSVEDKNSTAESYRNLANYFSIKNNYIEALKNINRSLKFSLYNNNIINDAISKSALLNTTGKRNISRALKAKTEILIALFNKIKNKKYLNDAISTVNLADELINIVLELSTETETKYLWRDEVSEIYNLGVNVAFSLKNPSLMFEFMEKNRAFLLNQNILKNNKDNKLPDEIKNLELSYRKRILAIENSNKIEQLKDSLFHLKEKYILFKDSVKHKHPQYLDYKKIINHVSINDVKRLLDKNEIIISYTLYKTKGTTNTLLGILISKNQTIPFKTKIETHQVTEYKKLVSSPLKTKKDFNSFKKTAHILYSQLLPSNEISTLIKNKNVTIIPDITFENIPFESLNTEEKTINYLVQNCNISYAYSYSFLNHNKKISRNTTNDFIGFAPIKFKNNTLTPLPYTEKETSEVNNLLNGRLFKHKQSSKAAFFDNSSQSKIIHLATHAKYSKSPTIYFSNDSLKLHELYTFKNNADLVVLSACQTNLGEIKKGEGTLSLTRGFFYAGSNSVISSLWNINDASSSYLMKKFYQNLTNNQSKTEALNNAKRTYLKEHSLSENSPYYWASFLLIGDSSPTFKSNNTTFFLIILVVFLIIIYFFQKKRVTKN